MGAFIDFGVSDKHECKFDGACYGEICINNQSCLKKWADMTIEEKKEINDFRKEIDLPEYGR
jgi:hypothetical protein